MYFSPPKDNPGRVRVLAFLPGADGEAGRPTREQVLADLGKPRSAFASALRAYHARLLEAAGHTTEGPDRCT
jgi:hypothetical protein